MHAKTKFPSEVVFNDIILPNRFFLYLLRLCSSRQRIMEGGHLGCNPQISESIIFPIPNGRIGLFRSNDANKKEDTWAYTQA